MNEVRWIKLATALPDNRKIKQIRRLPEGDSIALLWIFLLCLAGETNDDGQIYITKEVPYTDEMLAAAFDMEINAVRLGLQVFEQFGMLEIVDDILLISNWQKYQAADKLERLRETSRKTSAAYRERQKMLLSSQSDVTRDVTVTQSDATEKEEEIEIDKEIEKEKKYKREKEPQKRFTAPALDEIQAYIAEAGLSMDAEAFFDYYTSNGWKVGKQSMKDWKAAVRNWARRDNERKPGNKLAFSGDYSVGDDKYAAFFAASMERTKK